MEPKSDERVRVAVNSDYVCPLRKDEGTVDEGAKIGYSKSFFRAGLVLMMPLALNLPNSKAYSIRLGHDLRSREHPKAQR